MKRIVKSYISCIGHIEIGGQKTFSTVMTVTFFDKKL